MQVLHPCILPDVLVRRIENKLPLIDVSCKRNKNTQTKTNNPSHTPKGSKMPWCLYQHYLNLFFKRYLFFFPFFLSCVS